MAAHTDDIAEAKTRLREQFPGWNFILTRDTGRWWALKPDGSASTPSAVIADTPADLAEKLQKIPAP